MILLDTHVWIWWRSDPTRLSAAAAEAIAAADSAGVSSISMWELATLVRRGRISLDREVATWARQALRGVMLVPPGADVALAAGLLPDAFGGDPADRIIYATARHAGVRLVTRDERLAAFDPALTVW